MSQVVQAREAARRRLASLYGPIEDELTQVEQLLKAELSSRFPFIDQLVKHAFRLGGKRLRPALVLLAGQAAGRISHDHIVLAAVVEMIHTATLVHDDVLDEATLRRHLDTVNARWDNEASVLLGDYLFTHAFYLASTLGSTFACQTIGRATNVVCEGELRQIDKRGDFALSEAEYLSIIEAKTAELCACCCHLGAHYAGANEAVQQNLASYGRNVGVAFQIVDDLLDLQGDEAATGKSLGTDLEKQKATLPLIRLLEQVPSDQQAEIKSILFRSDNHRGEALATWFAEYDVLEYAHDKATAYIQQAQDDLTMLADSPARQSLHQLAEFVVTRRQ